MRPSQARCTPEPLRHQLSTGNPATQRAATNWPLKGVLFLLMLREEEKKKQEKK